MSAEKIKELIDKRNLAYQLLRDTNKKLQELRMSKCELLASIDDVDKEIEDMKREFNLERMRNAQVIVNS